MFGLVVLELTPRTLDVLLVLEILDEELLRTVLLFRLRLLVFLLVRDLAAVLERLDKEVLLAIELRLPILAVLFK